MTEAGAIARYGLPPSMTDLVAIRTLLADETDRCRANIGNEPLLRPILPDVVFKRRHGRRFAYLARKKIKFRRFLRHRHSICVRRRVQRNEGLSSRMHGSGRE